jgi:hypothetical protein
MTELLLFTAVGAGLLLLLVLVLRRPPAPAEGGAEALVAAKRSLHALQHGLLPIELVDRIFGKQDLEYVGSLDSGPVRDLFMKERKRLALAWVDQVRRQISGLRDFHTRRSRMFARMSRWTELSVGLDFADLQIQCRALHLVLQWRGPYAAPQLVRRTASTAAGLCAVLDKSLAFLTPAVPKRLGDDSGADAAAL